MGDIIYKILITTSGTGSRLGALTKKTNKALVEINGRTAIDYILDCYDRSLPLVITVGCLADQVIAFMNSHYPDRQIDFVPVNPYEGPGSSLGYSLLQASGQLQCPFIFHACDTIVLEQIPIPDHNWTAGFTPPSWDDLDVAQYRTHITRDNLLLRLNDKGVANFDRIHIGLSGIYDYSIFWQTLRALYEADPDNTALSDVHAIDAMIQNNIQFESAPLSQWLDTGNPAALQSAQDYLGRVS